jgi:dTDP-glucose 4,6-dehydratase
MSPQRALVTGGAGFLGSHLSDALLGEGWKVAVIDNLLTGRRQNLAHLANDSRFELIEKDICEPFDVGKVDYVFHFASPASPVDYTLHGIPTLRVGSLGTFHALEVALKYRAKYLVSSTSECYGDPLEHPQKETYWGNVNSIGPRSVYDEAKRFTEAVTMAYRRYHKVDTRIVRIFNTYGPRMQLNDGRVVPNFPKPSPSTARAARPAASAMSATKSTDSFDCQSLRNLCRSTSAIRMNSRFSNAPGTSSG